MTRFFGSAIVAVMLLAPGYALALPKTRQCIGVPLHGAPSCGDKYSGVFLDTTTLDIHFLKQNVDMLEFTLSGSTLTIQSELGASLAFSTPVAFSSVTSITMTGGVGALDFSSDGDSSMLVADNDATAFVFGSDGRTNLLTLDTVDGTETVIVAGTTAQTSLYVNIGGVLFDETLQVEGDITINGGAGALDASGDGDTSMLLKDNDSTAFIIGSTGRLNLLTFDTVDDQETVVVTGTTAQNALHVDTGLTLLDEDLTVGGDVAINGGAGALTLSGSGDSSIVLADGDATALVIGSTGKLNLLTFGTVDDQETVVITGTTATEALRVDTGNVLFDEDLEVSGDLTTGDIYMSSSTIAYTDEVQLGNTAWFLNIAAFEEGVQFPVATHNTGTGRTPDEYNCSETLFVGASADGQTLTLPDATDDPDWSGDGYLNNGPNTFGGCIYTIVFAGGTGVTGYFIAPSASDAIIGTCTHSGADVTFSGVAGAQIEMQKAGQKLGDSITLVSAGSMVSPGSWAVTSCSGVWRNKP